MEQVPNNEQQFTPPSKTMSIVSIVLGVLSCNLISLILGIMGNSKISSSATLNDPAAAQQSAQSGATLGKVGMILAIVGIILGIIGSILNFVFFAAAASEGMYY